MMSIEREQKRQASLEKSTSLNPAAKLVAALQNKNESEMGGGFVLVAPEEAEEADLTKAVSTSSIVHEPPAKLEPPSSSEDTDPFPSVPVMLDGSQPELKGFLEEGDGSSFLGETLGQSLALSDGSIDLSESLPEGIEQAANAPRDAGAPCSSLCQMPGCGAHFFGLEYNQRYFGLWGVRHHQCQHCWRSVCEPCSSNTLPLRVANIQERVCDGCFAALRGTALSAVKAQAYSKRCEALEKKRKAGARENSRLRQKMNKMKNETRAFRLLHQTAEEAKTEISLRVDAHEREAEQRTNQLKVTEEALRRAVLLREQEEAAAAQVKEAMEVLQLKLEAQCGESNQTKEEVAALTTEVEDAKVALSDKEKELDELREEQDDFQTTTFNPTWVKLSQLQDEARDTQEAIKALLNTLPPDVVATKGLGELDSTKMINTWGMSDDPEDGTCPFSLQESLLNNQGGISEAIKVDVSGEEPAYVFKENAALVASIKERYPQHEAAILGHILEVPIRILYSSPAILFVLYFAGIQGSGRL